MLRGRIVAARGVKSEELKPSNDSEWVLRSDRGLTPAGEIRRARRSSKENGGRRLSGRSGLDGEEDRRRPELGIGDEIVVNVLGATFREDRQSAQHHWRGSASFRAGVLARAKGAPHSHIAPLTEAHPDPAGDARIIKQAPTPSDGDERAGARGAGDHRRRHHQSRAGDPRRQRRDPDLGDPGAGQRACRRPSPPGL